MWLRADLWITTRLFLAQSDICLCHFLEPQIKVGSYIILCTNTERGKAFLSELTESTHILNHSLTSTFTSSNSVAEKRAKKFHAGQPCVLSPPEEKVLSKSDHRSLKQSKALSGLCKCFPRYSGIKAVFKK